MAVKLPVHQLLIAMLRVRNDKGMCDHAVFQRCLRRLIHWWCQSIEQQLEDRLLTTCPDMTIQARYHPWTRTSRQKGNRSMSLHLVQKFAARPSGYITMKGETSLRELGIVSRSSKIATKTSQEFCLRILGKCAEFVQYKCMVEGMRCINVCFDGAMVAQENVPLFELWYVGSLLNINMCHSM